MLTVHFQSISIFFSLCFSLPWAQVRSQNSPLPPVLALRWGKMLLKGHEVLGSKRCCCCSQLLCECKDDLPLLSLSLKNTELFQEAKQLLKEWAVGICWGWWLWRWLLLSQGEKDEPFISPDSKDTCALKASLPGKLVGIFHYCLHSSPWKLLSVSIVTLHTSCDSFPANWGRGLIMGS